jgi:hypothetical protein
MSVEPQPNPFSAPVNEEVSSNSIDQRVTDFGPIIRRWEYLRLYFNGILVSIVLVIVVFAFPSLFLSLEFWFIAIGGAVFTNLCYFAGPLVEGYASYFRLWAAPVTMVLFVAGLLLTAIVAVGAIVSLGISQ